MVILTFNEEANIGPCLGSCAWCDDVHVLDSGSKDRTREIAESMGARVWVNPFKSFGAQRNWAIDNIPTRWPWIFHLDADERFTAPIVAEIDALLGAEPAEAGFHVPSKLMFMDAWVRRAGAYPSYQVRLFHKDRLRFADHGHGQREETAGALGRLREPYLHYNFSKGLDDWYEKHNRYSSLEARQALEGGAPAGDLVRAALSPDAVARRRALKALSYRLPFRPTLILLYLLVARLGVLDGPAGWNYARLRATYEGMIATKLAALRAERKTPGGPPR